MAIPAYHWLKDDGGTDNMTGKITGTRVHSALVFEKEFDSSSPHLYKAVAKGQTLKSAEFKWYKINDAGHIGIKSPWHNTGVLMNAKKIALVWIVETLIFFLIHTFMCYIMPDVLLYDMYTRNFGFVTELDWSEYYTLVLFIFSFLFNALLIYGWALKKKM